MDNLVKIKVANSTEKYHFNYVAKHADGSVWLEEENTTILVAITIGETLDDDDIDFLPLTVQYIEKAYAAGRVPSGFIKREGKPSDFEVLTSRIIDRSLRPLFPKGFNTCVEIAIMVLSADSKSDLQRLALNAASAALFTSSLPITKSVCAARLTRINKEMIVNPTLTQLTQGEFDLYLAGTKENILMIEMQSLKGTILEDIELPLIDPMLDPSFGLQTISRQVDNVLSEADLLEAIALLQQELFAFNEAYESAFTPFIKPSVSLNLRKDSNYTNVRTFIEKEFDLNISQALKSLAKSGKSVILNDLVELISNNNYSKEHSYKKHIIKKVVNDIKKDKIRNQILNENIRADGRSLTQVRSISIETNILPRSHSSVLFTRGQTQVLAALTIGGSHDAQMYHQLTNEQSQYENLMIHYNFLGFSVGEISHIGAPRRRELGHGNLVKRAINPTFDNFNNETVRIVSEVLQSNGSSSMATVCASSLALKAANLNITDLVAGVAMGIVKEGEKYAILTDISGAEDHDGDMDLKIAGTKNGICALQMDIKLGGISLDILTKVFAQAKEARQTILNIMQESTLNIKKNSDMLSSIEQFVVDPSKISDIIGQAGKTIRKLIERFDVTIDLDKTKGKVKISGKSIENIKNAKDEIRNITQLKKKEYKIGDEIRGQIKKLVDFGAFIELDDNNDGLLHISKISTKHIDHPSEILKEGEYIDVKVSGFKGKKIELQRQ